MKKGLFNIINFALFIFLSGVFCGAYFLISNRETSALICFIACVAASLLSFCAALVSQSVEAFRDTFGTITITATNSLYILCSVALWVFFTLVSVSTRTVIFIEAVLMALYVLIAVSALVLSHYHNTAEQANDINLSTYILCSNSLSDISRAVNTPELKLQINSIAEQFKYIKSGSICVSNEIICQILSIKKHIKNNKDEQELTQMLCALMNDIEALAATLKI